MMAFSFSVYSQNNLLSDTVQNPTIEKGNPTLNDSVGSPENPLIAKKKPNQIDAEIKYKANDSIVLLGNGTAFLHGDTEINYQSITLKADYVRVKIDSSLVYAKGTQNEKGEVIGEPVFSEGESSYNSKELMYNLKSKKGYIRHVVTQEGEGYIISDRTKKTEDNLFCMTGGKYTTCENHDHPDFYLSISKGKVKPGEYIVTGPAHLVIADVPLPIALPFGFFPFSSKYSSGVLMPNYTDEMTRGFGLTNGGYYFAINDYMDLELRGDIYTKGTWALSATTSYTKRYKFRGNLSISYREDVTGEKGMSDYSKANNMSIRWSHSQDAKANPNFTFSSSVNFSTSGYNRSNVNSYYRPELNSENTKSSSISFTKRFADLPSLNISGSMLINQRTKDSTINLSLPNINLSYSRFYPFKRKNPVGNERWYEKISMSYTGAFANSIDTKENKLLSSSFTRDWRNGMRHSIPISATFNLFKFINISPSINYTERWYLRSIEKSWDKVAQKELNDTTDGFYRVFDFNMGVSASTKLYGFYIPLRSLFGDKIDRIRHVMTPSVGFGYTPDFGDPMWGYYNSYTKSVQSKTDPNVYTNSEVEYSRFAGALYGVPGKGKSGSINFSLGNNLEMKVRNDKDTTGTTPFKIISLIESLNIGGSYNLAADSMRWSQFSTSIRLKLSKNYSLSLSTSFDPYMFGLTSSGNPVRINQLRWNNGKFPRFQGTSTSYSYTFSNETFSKWFGKKDIDNKNKTGTTSTQDKFENIDGSQSDPSQQNSGNKHDNAATEIASDGYTKIKIPWSFSVNYSIRYGNSSIFNKDKMEYEMEFSHNLSVNGNISLTPNWRISGNSTYDFRAKQFTYTSISVNRSLHCWNMSASIVPFGMYKSYNFHIGVNASMLSDLKYDKRSEYGVNNITWY
ncbi:MAG: putative LPS assembly protein LptD [Paludibacter sp.]|nr:putative LPS assembly protein LptD [Paludibacter sp.]